MVLSPYYSVSIGMRLFCVQQFLKSTDLKGSESQICVGMSVRVSVGRSPERYKDTFQLNYFIKHTPFGDFGLVCVVTQIKLELSTIREGHNIAINKSAGDVE